MFLSTWDVVSHGAVVNCFRKAWTFKETNTGKAEDTGDPFKLFPKSLKELKLRGAVKESFDMDDYVDVDFDVSVTESFSLTNLDILAAVWSVAEEDDAEDEELPDQDGVEPLKKLPQSDIANAIDLIKR